MNCLRIIAIAAAAGALLMGGMGCGGGKEKPIKVQGKVTLDGQAVDSASVLFAPVGGKGQQATGVSGSDGVYRLTTYDTGDGALPGDYHVLITKADKSENKGIDVVMDPSNPQDSMKKAYGQFMQKSFSKKPTEIPKLLKSKLPQKYADPTKPLLQAKVPTPDGKYDFELDSK